MTDEYIVQRVLDGNTHIFSEIVDKYKDKVFSMVYRFTNDYNEAQDLSQEVFIQVFKGLHLYNEKAKFSTWLYRISYNLSVDWSRKNKKRLKQLFFSEENLKEPFDEGSDIEKNFIEKQKQILLRKAVSSLKEKYRTVIILYNYQNFSYEEIAEIIKMPVKTVETRIYRARKLLRKSIGNSNYGGELYEVQSDA